jgi:multiple sugar transport system permease protein
MSSITVPIPSLLSPVAHNWKLALLSGLAVSVLAAASLPANISFWIIFAMAIAIAAAFATNAYRRKYYGGLLFSL